MRSGYLRGMDLSTSDVLIGLAAIAATVCIAAALHLGLRGNGRGHVVGGHAEAARGCPRPGDDRADRPQSTHAALRGDRYPVGTPADEPDRLSATGRHHVPPGLLDASTTRIRPDVLARVTSPTAKH
jgi:hypothetical protein